MNYINKDSIFNLLYLSEAVSVTPDDDEILEKPGIIFLDKNSTEGDVKVELLNGGVITIELQKYIPYPFVVRKVFNTDTTAGGILLNRISQRKK